MEAIITHYKVDENGDVVYENKKPVTETTIVDFPLEFGYHNYNEERKLLGPTRIEVDQIIKIEVA